MEMNKKNILLSILLLFLTVFAVTSLAEQSAEPAQETIPLDRIVAVVNDEIITEGELETAMKQMQQDLAARNIQLPAGKSLREETLEGLINFRLQLQVANRVGIKPTEKEIDDAIVSIAKSHHLTEAQLKEQLVLQQVNYADFRNQIKDQYAVTKLQQQMVTGQIKITDADVAKFKKDYENASHDNDLQYHFVDFLIPLSADDNEETINNQLEQARHIQQQLNQGENIDNIQPPFVDLGWRDKNDLPQLFLEQIDNLSANKVSEPLRAPNGFHVLKLLETRSNQAPLPSDDEIRQIIFRQKYEIALKEAIEKMRKEASIQIIPDDNKPGEI